MYIETIDRRMQYLRKERACCKCAWEGLGEN